MVAADLISVPPMIFRGVRRKLVRTALEDDHDNITPVHIEVIRLLEEEGTLHAAEIGSRLQIAKAQITQLIDKLVGLDIVARHADRDDRRSINISLTEHGKKTMARHKKILINAVRESMSVLSDAELEDLSVSLRKLRDILTKLQ